MNRGGAPNVLLLPLGTPDKGYPGTTHPGLKTVAESAFLCLWNQCAVARDIPSTDSLLDPGADPAPVQKPGAKARQLWLVGHSAGNGLMRVALAANGQDVDRVITFSATEASKNLEPLIGVLGTVAAARGDKKKKLEVFVGTAPDLTHHYDVTAATAQSPQVVRGASMDPAHARQLIATGASVTFLPPFDDQFNHYTISPASRMRPFLHHLLGQWSDQAIEQSASVPHNWEHIFFHEYPVFGGDLDSTTTPASVRTFFLQALGAPSPLTTPPRKYPP
jgi:hypothetical protein